MSKFINPSDIIRGIVKTTRSTITPFQETPSIDKSTRDSNTTMSGMEGHTRIAASDLFSFFTANIIREEVMFTR